MRIASPVILGLLLSLNVPAHPYVKTGARPGWLYAIHPDWHKTPAREAISDGLYYDLLDFQTNLTCNTDYTHFIRNIVNQSGVQNGSEVSVTFSPEFQQVVFHRIAILRDGAVLDRLQPENIKVVQEESDAGEFQYNGLKRAFLTLKDVRKGDRIEVAYSVIGFNPVFGNKYSDDFSFNASTAVCNYYKTIITTYSRPLYIRTLNNAPQPARQHKGSTLVYSWQNPTLSTDDPATDAPSWYEDFPTVYVTEYPSWRGVIDWGLKTFNHYHYPLPAELKQKMAGWQNQAKGDTAIFAGLAIRFVQDEVRYLGLEIGANTHRPHPPADVFAQRFGDCKDKTLLLAAILQQENIPAYTALISTDTRSRLPTVAPSPQAFDHAIVAIRNPSGGYSFVDPTRTGQRGPLADLFIPDYGYALVLNEADTGLQRVTPGRINDYAITETLDARYYDTSWFSITSVYSGGAADDLRGMFAGTSEKDLEDTYRKYYGALFDDIRQQGHINYSEDSEKNIVTVSKRYAIPQLWNTEKNGKRYFGFRSRILEQNLPDPADAPDNTPLGLDYPFNARYTLNLSLPEDWSFSDGPLHIHNDSYQFDFVPEVNGSNMVLHYTFRTLRDNISAADLRQYKADYKKISVRISFQLVNNITPDDPPREEPSASPGPLPSSLSFRDWKVCWPAIWLTFFFSLFFSRLFQYLNSRGEETLYAPGSGYPLGGRIALLGISLGVIILSESGGLLMANYYSNAHYIEYGNAGGHTMQYIFLSQLGIHLSFIAGAAALLFWFFKKRDIFPRMFLWYTGILAVGRLFLLGLSCLPSVSSLLISYRPGLLLALGYTLVYTTLGIVFILRSEQVKSTFLEPYREAIR
jgi:transglutaminase-like putative cysteine protease